MGPSACPQLVAVRVDGVILEAELGKDIRAGMFQALASNGTRVEGW